jgi:hypothetical protein
MNESYSLMIMNQRGFTNEILKAKIGTADCIIVNMILMME